MANNPMGGYTAPNYGNYGYTGQSNYNPNNFNQNLYNNPYTQPFANTLRNTEMQNPQFGQTMPPPINNQQFQQNIAQPTQQQSTPNPFSTVAIVASTQEASQQIPDMVNGTKAIFYDTSTDKIYVNYFDFETGKKVFRIYETEQPNKIENQNEPTQAVVPVESIESKQVEYATDEDIQPLRCQISGLTAMYDELKAKYDELERELFDDEPYGTSANDGATKSNGKAAHANGTGNAGTKSQRRPDDSTTSKPVPTATGKSNAGESKRKDTPAD